LELLPAGLSLAESLFCHQTSSINPLKNVCHMCTTVPIWKHTKFCRQKWNRRIPKNPMQTNHQRLPVYSIIRYCV